MPLPPKLLAFWNYDLFPFVLGGTITKMSDQGSVETEEFGHGCWFRPVRILPEKRGKEILANLKTLQTEYEAALATLKRDYEARAQKVMKS